MDKSFALIAYLPLLLARLVVGIPIDIPRTDFSSNKTIGKDDLPILINRLPLNLTGSPSTCPSNPTYGQFDIPNSPLSLDLELRDALKAEAIDFCLTAAAAWIEGQTKSATMKEPNLDWKDVAGAEFYIAPTSAPLTWQNVADVVRGLKSYQLGSVTQKPVNMEASFTVVTKSGNEMIGQGYLVKYERPPLPPSVGGLVQTSQNPTS